MKFPDGTAAVSVEAALVDESRSLGNWEGRELAAGGSSVSASQKTCSEIALTADMRMTELVNSQKYGCGNFLRLSQLFYI